MSGRCVNVGELVDGCGCAVSSLALSGQVEDHSEQAALVGDGSDWAHLGVLMQAFEELLPDFPPRDEFGKVLLHFGEGLFAQGSGSFRCFSGWVGSIEDGGVDFFS